MRSSDGRLEFTELATGHRQKHMQTLAEAMQPVVTERDLLAGRDFSPLKNYNRNHSN